MCTRVGGAPSHTLISQNISCDTIIFHYSVKCLSQTVSTGNKGSMVQCSEFSWLFSGLKLASIPPNHKSTSLCIAPIVSKLAGLSEYFSYQLKLCYLKNLTELKAIQDRVEVFLKLGIYVCDQLCLSFQLSFFLFSHLFCLLFPPSFSPFFMKNYLSIKEGPDTFLSTEKAKLCKPECHSWKDWSVEKIIKMKSETGEWDSAWPRCVVREQVRDEFQPERKRAAWLHSIS